MKKTIAAPGGVTPRLAAERFGKSTWLLAVVCCLGVACALTLASTMMGRTGIQLLDIVSAAFNMLYAFAAAAALFFLWQLRSHSSADSFKKAGKGCLAVGVVLLLTASFLAMFYFSAYTIFGSLTPEDMAEMELTQEYIDEMWAMLPYFVLSLVCTALGGVAFMVFWRALRRLSEMAVGKSASAGLFTGCSVVAALAGGFVLLRMFLDLTMSAGLVHTVFILLENLAEAGVFAGITVLSQETASALRGE